MGSWRDKLVTADDDRVEKVTIPEWDDVTFEVRPITVESRNRLLTELGSDDAYYALVIACTFDPETGEPAFTTADVDTLKRQSPRPLDRILEVASRLNGLTDDAVESGKGDS